MIQILLTILSSSVKFALTFPLVILQFNFSFLETILWTNVGGILGFYFFAFLSDKLIRWWNKVVGKKLKPEGSPAKKKKTFTKKNRRIVRIKQKYGLIGIALTTPVLLSIPLGTFLVVRYYRSSRIKYMYMIVSIIIWSFIYTLFYTFWEDLIFKKG